ncbi:short-chain dehydrogenase/reductase family 16C member 6 isoform X1 [Bombus pyrosoma]|uniref:short-chain dehydrogenase/reductase family 16C member 6 isoform X1 n=1 Tax=Bombus pyrosoma TaxID=396416 RepID=UPI001CB8A29A|nr:short-chain dehydrogenase/reductase family 16C member 6 isoform X1 [Bombus pyrosoma]XP_043593283.1 short-chain dehydrogenase/reductase family 16C member 6 isoform X1 [Bombus pyrosoma]
MVQVQEALLVLLDTLLLVLKILYDIALGIYRLCIPVEEKSVIGEIVLITGTGHGIGKELALRYASLGAIVVCLDVNEEGNNETVNEINQNDTLKAYGYKCDVSNREEVLKIAKKVKEEVGDVTILINNAGIMPCFTFMSHTPEQIKRIFDINVLAHFWIFQAFLPSMIERNYGHIVALSSIAGIIGQPNIVPYCASKFAVRGLMESLYEELRSMNKEKPLNINFTTVYPYMVNTGLCKNPCYRFKNVMSLVSTKQAVDIIVKAQRQNTKEISIPTYWHHINTIIRCMPSTCIDRIRDFMNAGLKAEC